MTSTFRTRLWLLSLSILVWSLSQSATSHGAEPEVVRVMSFNMWNGGDSGKQPLAQSIAVIKESRADVVGLQETAGRSPKGQPRPDRAAEIAKQLGWNYVDLGMGRGIISRYKIHSVTPKKWGAKLELPSGRELYHFNVHLAHSPYQPYQLFRIPYGNAPFVTTAAEAVVAAQAARGRQINRMLKEVKNEVPEGVPMFLTGDFNEPSHLDWTPANVKAKQCPLAVEWPTTKAVEAAGFVDAYRAVHPDPVKKRGLTWTPITAIDDPKDRHDRIDMVFIGGVKVNVRTAQIVGEKPEFADLVVTPYPSDHRAVVAEVELPPVPSAGKKSPAK